MINYPILILGYNRPEKFSQVLFQCAILGAKEIFVSIDGPVFEEKKNDVTVKHNSVIEHVRLNYPDINIEVKYWSYNLGVKKGVSEGISWFFSRVDQGIILEDDCLPSSGFFKFVEFNFDLLKTKPNLFAICGTTFNIAELEYYSRFCHVWGWATTKEKWSNFSQSTPKLFLRRVITICHAGEDFVDRLFWIYVLVVSLTGRIRTWDYDWNFSIWENSGYCLIPGHSYVTNLGFDADATRTKNGEQGLRLEKDFLDVRREETRYIFDKVISYKHYRILERMRNKLLQWR